MNEFFCVSLAPSQPYMVVGMQQDTVYEVRVAARTMAGTGDFSAPKTDKTKKWVPTAAPSLNKAGQAVSYYSSSFPLTLLMAALISAAISIWK